VKTFFRSLLEDGVIAVIVNGSESLVVLFAGFVAGGQAVGSGQTIKGFIGAFITRGIKAVLLVGIELAPNFAAFTDFVEIVEAVFNFLRRSNLKEIV